MEDDTSNDTLDYDEIKAAIPSLGFIDVVGYDGCNMASLEIMDLWHGHATAITGSQEYVGWDGLEYDVVPQAAEGEPDHDAPTSWPSTPARRPSATRPGRRWPSTAG